MSFPPIHPLLVNFTAALVPVSFLCDLAAVWVKKDALRVVAVRTLAFAAVVTPFTALAGWLWMRSMDHADHWQMPVHLWVGVSIAVVLLSLAVWRVSMQRRGDKPGWLYAVCALLVFAALAMQAELGASMSFGSGIFLRPHETADHHDSTAPQPHTHDHDAEPHSHGKHE